MGINHPLVLASAGISAYKLAYEQFGSLSDTEANVIYLVSFFVINLISVSIPDRLDDELATEIAACKASNKPLPPSALSITGGRTLIAPAPWAFAIWGPIYLSEMVLMFYIALSKGDRISLSTAAPYWFLASVSQALWCASFRRKYVLGSLPSTLSSPTYLLLTSLLLTKTHAILSSSKYSNPWFVTLPIALHAGWTMAASIVNVNGALAYKSVPLNLQRYVGHLSVALAVGIAVFAAKEGAGIVIPMVLAWALRAVGAGMKQRIDGKQGNLVGAKTQMNIANAGSAIAVTAGIWGRGRRGWWEILGSDDVDIF